MKSIQRKLLSLLLAMAMVLTLVPTALADGEYSVSVTGNSTATVGTPISLSASVTESGQPVTLEASAYSWTTSNNKVTISGSGASVSVSASEAVENVTITCSVTTTTGEAPDTVTKTGSDSTTVSFTAAPTVTISGLQETATLTYGSNTNGSVTLTATVGGSPSAPSNTGVTWAITGGTNQNAVSLGAQSTDANPNSLTVTANSVTTQGTAIVTATSKADPTKAMSCTITVNPAATTYSATISPGVTTLYYNGTNNNSTTLTVTSSNAPTGYTMRWSVNPAGALRVDGSTSPYTITAGDVATTKTVKVQGTIVVNGVDSGTTNEVTITVHPYNSYSLEPYGSTLSTVNTIYLNDWSGNYYSEYMTFSVVPRVLQGGVVATTTPTVTYQWSLNGTPINNATTSSFTLYSNTTGLLYGNQDNKLRCTANITGAPEPVYLEWTIRSGYATANYLASVNVTNSYYYTLGDRDDANGNSIVTQLANLYHTSASYTATGVQFLSNPTHTYGSINGNTSTTYSLSSTGSNYFGNLVFTPSSSTGRATFSVRVYFNNLSTNYIDGTISFDTTGGTYSGDINYGGSIGDTIYFDASDFADFYYSKTSGGSLSYVTFSTVNTGTGTLYCDGARLSSGTPCYYSSSYRQSSLDGVYFTPSGNTASKGGTVRISFTASGTRGNYGYSNTVSGTVVINYLNGSAKDITYTPLGSSINLSASDFTAAYREVMGTTAPSDLTIQFQDVPANGTLTYKSSSTNTVTLRSNNIKSYRFRTSGSGSNLIGDVTYSPSGTRSDTIEYIAYTGNVARFTGKVVFNPSSASTTVIVTLTCPGSTGGAFNQAAFSQANPWVMTNTSQVRFVMPSRGTLTYNGQTVGANGVTVPVGMIGYVYYRPNAGMNGTDIVAFVCLDANGNQVGTGQVNVVVSGNTGTSNTTGVTSISQFTDVPANAWYASVLSDLVSKGIVQGTGNGKAEPRGTLNYGQALKMILLAAGYPAQVELNSGSQWAANYKSLAVSNGLIDSGIDLTAPISRDAVVELAAKALKVAPVSGNSPFKDSNNGYAIALNRTNPAIIIGNEDGTFNGSSTLLRQEIWAIVYRMNQYTGSQYRTQMPDGI